MSVGRRARGRLPAVCLSPRIPITAYHRVVLSFSLRLPFLLASQSSVTASKKLETVICQCLAYISDHVTATVMSSNVLSCTGWSKGEEALAGGAAVAAAGVGYEVSTARTWSNLIESG